MVGFYASRITSRLRVSGYAQDSRGTAFSRPLRYRIQAMGMNEGPGWSDFTGRGSLEAACELRPAACGALAPKSLDIDHRLWYIREVVA